MNRIDLIQKVNEETIRDSSVDGMVGVVKNRKRRRWDEEVILQKAEKT